MCYYKITLWVYAHKSLFWILSERGVSCTVAGGMGMRAQELFSDAKIESILGVERKIHDVIDKLLSGTLKGGESICNPGADKGYVVDKSICDHSEHDHD